MNQGDLIAKYVTNEKCYLSSVPIASLNLAYTNQLPATF